MSDEKKLYSGIDLFKLAAACLVVLLHATETTAWLPHGIKYVLTSLTVPFFFMASGFFFYTGLNRSKCARSYFIKYEKNIFRLFVLWAVFLTGPFTIMSYIDLYEGFHAGVLLSVLLRRFFIIGPGAYWYLIALMWSAAFLYFCFAKKNNTLLYIGIIIGLIMEITYTCFQGLLSQFVLCKTFFRIIYVVFSWENNFLMYGIPFMGVGYLIAKTNLNLPAKKATALLLLATVGATVEYSFPKLFPSSFWLENKIELCFILQAFFYFMLSKEVDLKISNKTSYNLRQMSLFIYLIHVPLLNDLLNPLLTRFCTVSPYASSMILPKVCILLTICCLLFLIIKKINNRYLNVLLDGQF